MKNNKEKNIDFEKELEKILDISRTKEGGEAEEKRIILLKKAYNELADLINPEEFYKNIRSKIEIKKIQRDTLLNPLKIVLVGDRTELKTLYITKDKKILKGLDKIAGPDFTINEALSLLNSGLVCFKITRDLQGKILAYNFNSAIIDSKGLNKKELDQVISTVSTRLRKKSPQIIILED